MDVSCETPDVTTTATCYDLADEVVSATRLQASAAETRSFMVSRCTQASDAEERILLRLSLNMNIIIIIIVIITIMIILTMIIVMIIIMTMTIIIILLLLLLLLLMIMIIPY